MLGIFSGSDDDDDEGTATHGDDEVEFEFSAHTGFREPSTGEDNGGSLSDWFRTHTISLDSDVDAPDTTDGPTEPATPSGPDPTPSHPQVTPSTGGDAPSRGTVAFPNNQDFLEKVGTRGLNGAHDRVETVYVITGPTYTMPRDLIKLNEPEYYASATRASVRSYNKMMAEKVAALYPDDQTPKMIIRFHTHPGGTTSPSSVDKTGAEAVKNKFENALGSDDFEFFQGIHAFVDHNSNPPPEERHQPSARSNGVSWKGEQYRHDLALYGPKFKNPRKVVIADV